MPKLTKTYIDKVQPPASGYAMHWCDSVKGYGLRVSSQGKRAFVAMGRVKGKNVQFTIGAYGVLTEDQARKKAQIALQQMREGIDPRDARKADEAMEVTLRTVADAYFARPGKLKKATRDEMDRQVKTVFKAWEAKPIASITEGDVRKRYRKMTTEGMRGKPAVGMANLSMTTLRTLINFAARQYRRADGSPLIAHNPVLALKDDWIELKPRSRDIDAKKVGEVWHMLAEAHAAVRKGDDDAKAGVDLARFLLLTGARRNEGAMLTWDRVNLDEGWFHLPDPKNSNPVWIPLSSQAVDLLTARKPADGDKTASKFVFPSRSKAGHVSDTRAPFEKISKVAGLHLSAHDLRRTFVSVGVATLGIDLHKIELLTNHVPKGVTARHYLQTSRLQYLQPEVQQIGDWIEQQGAVARAKAEGGNVVPLRA